MGDGRTLLGTGGIAKPQQLQWQLDESIASLGTARKGPGGQQAGDGGEHVALLGSAWFFAGGHRFFVRLAGSSAGLPQVLRGGLAGAGASAGWIGHCVGLACVRFALAMVGGIGICFFAVAALRSLLLVAHPWLR